MGSIYIETTADLMECNCFRVFAYTPKGTSTKQWCLSCYPSAGGENTYIATTFKTQKEALAVKRQISEAIQRGEIHFKLKEAPNK